MFFLTKKEYISLLKNPENVKNTHIADFYALLENFPFLTSARALLALALKQSENVNFPLIEHQSALYMADRRWFYFFLYPEKINLTGNNQTRMQSSGEYFDMLEKIERSGGDTRQSLRSLAEKLKSARQEFSTQNLETEKKTQNIEIKQIKDDFYWIQKEKEAKNLIVAKKYSAALAILREINLNIPKKSIYFADQIRFLEKIIQISNNY